MAKGTIGGLVVVLMLIGSGSAAFAEESVGVDLSADFMSKYIWRGQNLNDDYAFQPGAAVSYAGFTAAVWGSLDLTDIGDNKYGFTEVDYSLDYSTAVPGIDWLGFSAGVINYHFPGVVGDTTEVYWGFAADLPLSPSFTVYHDIDEVDGTYISFGLGHSIDQIAELAPGVPVGMEIGASLGWGDSDYNAAYWGIDESKLNDLTLSVAFPIEIGGWTLAPSINYVTLLSDEIRATDSYARGSDYFFTGLSLSTSF